MKKIFAVLIMTLMFVICTFQASAFAAYRSSNTDSDSITAIFIVIIVTLVIFFITRQFWCWYWKINARLYETIETNVLLTKMREALLVTNNGISKMQETLLLMNKEIRTLAEIQANLKTQSSEDES